MVEWRHTTVGELCDAGFLKLQTGPFGSQLHAYDYVKAGVSVVPTEAIQNRRIKNGNLPQITPEKAKELSRHRLLSGDILFARRGVQATGKVAYVRPDEDGFLCGTGAIRLRVRDGKAISSEFLSHVFADPTAIAWFKFHAIGATMPNLNEGIIRSFPLRLPPLPEQQTIAGLLSALEDKIDLNHCMNKTLEAMTRAIFKDWFIDFGPVRAKMEGRNPCGLALEIAALFPDRLGEDGLPEGFYRRELSTMTSELRRGVSPRYVDHGGVVVLNQKCVRDGQVDFTHARRHDNNSRSVVGRTLVTADILVNSTGTGTLGRVAQLWNVPEAAIVDGHVTVVRADVQKISNIYLGLDLTQRETEIEALGEGSTGQTELSRARLGSLKVVVPTKALLSKFDALSKPFIDRREHNRHQSVTLGALRDLLLPKLITGELRFKDAEKLLEEPV